MTKYILHGGRAGVESEANKMFFREITKGVGKTVKFLCVYFARENSASFEQDKQLIASACPVQEIRFSLADKELGQFTRQIGETDVVFLFGGLTSSLMNVLIKLPSLTEIWKDKIIAGSSAGAAALSSYFYDGDTGSFAKGLGILPVKVFCHWGPQCFPKFEGLKEYGEARLEVLALCEQEFIVIEQ